MISRASIAKSSLIISLSLLYLTGYHSAMANHNTIIENTVIDMTKPIPEALLAEYNRDGIIFDYDNTPVLKQIFVTDKEGAVARQLPSGAARKVTNYSFGEQLEVIEDRQDWYAVRDRIYREYDDDNDGIVETDVVKWEKVFVKKEQTGNINSISLIPDDLNVIAYLLVDDYEFFEEEERLNDYLKIELIDKALFEQKRPLSVNFLSKDNIVKKKNGVLSIPTTRKIVTFTDKDVDHEGRETFEYVGQIDNLNQHLVSGSYWESGDYTMIDKDTGKVTQTFIDYPYISPNKKNIISAYTNPYEQYTDLELYKVDGQSITMVMSAGFNRWMPSVEPADIFWARDGYLYLAVTHSAAFWTADGSLNDKHQYIRIKVDM